MAGDALATDNGANRWCPRCSQLRATKDTRYDRCYECGEPLSEAPKLSLADAMAETLGVDRMADMHPDWRVALIWRGYDSDRARMQARCTHCKVNLGHADTADEARKLFDFHKSEGPGRWTVDRYTGEITVAGADPEGMDGR